MSDRNAPEVTECDELADFVRGIEAAEVLGDAYRHAYKNRDRNRTRGE